MASSVFVPTTRNPAFDGLLSGLAWDGPITFGFPNSSAAYESPYSRGEPSTGFSSLSLAARNAVRAALLGTQDTSGNHAPAGMGVSQFTLLDITETVVGADIRIAESTRPPTAWAYHPGSGNGGDVWFGTAYAGTGYDLRNPVPGNTPIKRCCTNWVMRSA